MWEKQMKTEGGRVSEPLVMEDMELKMWLEFKRVLA